MGGITIYSEELMNNLMYYLQIALFSIFLILAIFHFYWAFGGRWGFYNSLPCKEDGTLLFEPRSADCLIVGIGLTSIAFFYCYQALQIPIPLPVWLIDLIGWVIPIIFILRTFGDFKYVGFTKKVKTTKFAELDTRFFSPLCFSIGVIALLLKLY